MKDPGRIKDGVVPSVSSISPSNGCSPPSYIMPDIKNTAATSIENICILTGSSASLSSPGQTPSDPQVLLGKSMPGSRLREVGKDPKQRASLGVQVNEKDLGNASCRGLLKTREVKGKGMKNGKTGKTSLPFIEERIDLLSPRSVGDSVQTSNIGFKVVNHGNMNGSLAGGSKKSYTFDASRETSSSNGTEPKVLISIPVSDVESVGSKSYFTSAEEIQQIALNLQNITSTSLSPLPSFQSVMASTNASKLHENSTHQKMMNRPDSNCKANATLNGKTRNVSPDNRFQPSIKNGGAILFDNNGILYTSNSGHSMSSESSKVIPSCLPSIVLPPISSVPHDITFPLPSGTLSPFLDGATSFSDIASFASMPTSQAFFSPASKQAKESSNNRDSSIPDHGNATGGQDSRIKAVRPPFHEETMKRLGGLDNVVLTTSEPCVMVSKGSDGAKGLSFLSSQSLQNPVKAPQTSFYHVVLSQDSSGKLQGGMTNVIANDSSGTSVSIPITIALDSMNQLSSEMTCSSGKVIPISPKPAGLAGSTEATSKQARRVLVPRENPEMEQSKSHQRPQKATKTQVFHSRGAKVRRMAEKSTPSGSTDSNGVMDDGTNMSQSLVETSQNHSSTMVRHPIKVKQHFIPLKCVPQSRTETLESPEKQVMMPNFKFLPSKNNTECGEKLKKLNDSEKNQSVTELEPVGVHFSDASLPSILAFNPVLLTNVNGVNHAGAETAVISVCESRSTHHMDSSQPLMMQSFAQAGNRIQTQMMPMSSEPLKSLKSPTSKMRNRSQHEETEPTILYQKSPSEQRQDLKLRSSWGKLENFIQPIVCYRCVLCSYIHTTEKNLFEHIETEHRDVVGPEEEVVENGNSDSYKFLCSECNSMFPTMKSLKMHFVTSHEGLGFNLVTMQLPLKDTTSGEAQRQRNQRDSGMAMNGECHLVQMCDKDSEVDPMDQSNHQECGGNDKDGSCMSSGKDGSGCGGKEEATDCLMMRERGSRASGSSEGEKSLPLTSLLSLPVVTLSQDVPEHSLHVGSHFLEPMTLPADLETLDSESLWTSNDIGLDVENSASSLSKRRGRPKGSKNLGITQLRKNNPDMRDDKALEKEVGFKCDVNGCAIRIKSRETLDYHRRCHSGEVFACPECKEHFSHWRNLSVHLWRAHVIDMELYSCDQCNYKTYSQSKLMNLHKRIHSSERPYLCDTCGKGFKTNKQLRSHKTVHQDKKVSKRLSSRQCDLCQRVFSDKRMLRMHRETVHMKIRPFLCNFCGYSASCRSTLKMHLRQHTGEKPFACDICEYKTGDHNSLRRHKMRHDGVKPYKCPYCSYACIQSSTYKTHLKNKHPGQDEGLMFTCDMCSYRTIKRDTFITHMADHRLGILPVKKQENCQTPSHCESPALEDESVHSGQVYQVLTTLPPLPVSSSSSAEVVSTSMLPMLTAFQSAVDSQSLHSEEFRSESDSSERYPVLSSQLKVSDRSEAVSLHDHMVPVLNNGVHPIPVDRADIGNLPSLPEVLQTVNVSDISSGLTPHSHQETSSASSDESDQRLKEESSSQDMKRAS
ncbi:unnamed protein product [Darwinula stevensoni]|uniref:C2H2-type domain-containing protein n=1 Tax=Darwinula stevensoni TaxID=69355 RepID=A0A7R9FS65_9CRUS|nr:unnamed protein product [Darwinula stevensoni]CAG0902032.1 unnamed protein product [Darwinula stevensoni]